MQIGPYRLNNALILAPMAGVTDLPFRKLCRKLGAGMAVGEMSTSIASLWHTRKSRLRANREGEPAPRVAQIVGTEPGAMSEAARFNVDQGAQIIDINMGCPAKKVCNRAAGSALMRDEALVGRILDAVVAAVDGPVTLKIRTGWSPSERNAVSIARIAEDSGIKAIAVHGRTRACAFSGEAEYRTIRAVKESVSIPVIANGDIDSPEKARMVIATTRADALMIGRAALGRPWLFDEIAGALDGPSTNASPDGFQRLALIREHLTELYAFYGEERGVHIARKHCGWYLRHMAGIPPSEIQRFNACPSASAQLALLADLVVYVTREKAA